eukprot:s768_g15.t1
MALLTPEECEVDVCVLGTGLTESLVAAAFARLGRRLLHLDASSAYGGCWRSLSLAEFVHWAGGSTNFETSVSQVSGGDFRSLPPQAWKTIHRRCTKAPLGAEIFRQRHDFEEEREPEVPFPLQDEALASGEIALRLAPHAQYGCFVDRSFEWDPFDKLSGVELCKEKRALLKSPTSFSLDIVPRLLFGRSDYVDVLVESGVARYLEFQGLKSARVLTPEGLFAVPLTKSEIFQDAHLSKPEKRTLMRFITSIQPFVGSLSFQSAAQLGVDQVRKVKGPTELDSGSSVSSVLGVDLQEPWHRFLEKQQLSQRLQEFITYSICLWDWSPPSSSYPWPELSCGEALRRLGSFVSSLGMYGRGTSMPLLYPMYGVAEIAQGFTRMSALHRGTYALRTRPTHLVAKKDEQHGWQMTGVVTHRGEVIRASTVIGSCDHITQDGILEQGSDSTACRRSTVLLNRPLLGEDGVNLCVVPPSSFAPPLKNVVQVLQLDWSTGTCPRGYYVHHLSQAWIGGDPDSAFADIDKVFETLFARCEEATCLFRCKYIHKPRPIHRWSTEDSPMTDCSAAGSLAVVADPSAVPQLVVSDEIDEARQIFLASPAAAGAHADDFLRKPEHVAEEERGGVMEELELFNEQMQETKQAETGKLHADELQP